MTNEEVELKLLKIQRKIPSINYVFDLAKMYEEVTLITNRDGLTVDIAEIKREVIRDLKAAMARLQFEGK